VTAVWPTGGRGLGGRERVVDHFRDVYGRSPDLVVRAPGRVNLLGGHVDYNDGWVLPGAIDRAIWLAAARGSRPFLRASSLELGPSDPVALDPVRGPAAAVGRVSAGWIEYPAGVGWALERAGHEVAPIDAAIGSELPAGAGASSSAALEVAFLVAWRELGSLALDDLEAARLCRQVENEYIGVQSGIMDPFASLHGRRDQVVLLDCRTLDWERLPLPDGAAILVADTGVRRRLAPEATPPLSSTAGGPLNERRAECAAALRELQTRFSDRRLAALRDVSPETVAQAGFLPDALQRRVRHVVEECARVRRGAALLRDAATTRRDGAGTAAALGALMRDSHRSSRDLYQVSIPELDLLAEAAWAAPGCHGARLVGAGFGGCVVALIAADRAPAVAAAMEHAFAARFGRAPVVHRCSITDGAAIA
jgi:galactokinase